MKLKTFTTHTLSLVKEVVAIELAFNVWAAENKNIKIERTDYEVVQRVNKNDTKYEELILLVFYS